MIQRIPQVRQQYRHLPHPNRRLFRRRQGRTELRAALHGLRAILVRRRGRSCENQQQYQSSPSMCRSFIDGGLERGASVEAAVAPRPDDSPGSVVAFACALGTKRTDVFALYFLLFFAFVFCFCLCLYLLTLVLQCTSTSNSKYLIPKRVGKKGLRC